MGLRTAIIFLALLLRAESAFGQGRPVSLIDLANLSDIGGNPGAINVSPNGRWVVFQLQTPNNSKGDYELSWIAISTHSGKTLKVAEGGDILLNPTLGAWTNGSRPQVRAKWSPDSKWFVYLVRQNGQTQIWGSHPDRKGRVQLTHNAARVIDFHWSPDGSKLYFTTGLTKSQIEESRKEESSRGFLYDDRFAPTRSAQPILRNCKTVNGRIRAVSLERACEPPIWIYDFEARKVRLATSEEAEVYKLDDGIIAPAAIEARNITNLRQSVDGSKYAWLENEDPETYRGIYPPLRIHALVDDVIRRCGEDACSAYGGPQGMWWSEDGQELVFLRREGHNDSEMGLYAWTPSSGELRKILQTDDWLSDCAPADDSLICLYETWTQPRRIVSVSLEVGTIATLFDPNPDFNRHHFPKIEKLEWEDVNGNETHGHLVYPISYKSGSRYPLVIVTYLSTGFLRGGVGDEYPVLPLAAEGVFVLSHDLPLDTESLATASDAEATRTQYFRRRENVLSSQEIVIERLVRAGLIDRERVAITGLSEGTAQVKYALIHSDAFTAAIADSAYGSYSSYYLQSESLRNRRRNMMNGPPDDPDSGTHILSIGLNAERVETPLLINVSEEEFLGSVENVVRLQDAGKPVEMYVFPGEHHIKWRPDHRLAIYRRNIQWLKFWLTGEEASDPLDPNQYKRWRELRDEQCTRLNGADMPWYCENGELNLVAK